MSNVRMVGSGANEYRISDGLVDTVRGAVAASPARLPALPQTLMIDRRRTALIVIDMQNDFCHPAGWIGAMGVDNASLRAIYAPINRATAAARAAGLPVLWVNWGVRPDLLNLSPGTQHPFNPNGAGPGLGGTTTGPHGDYRVLTQGEWGAAIVDDLDVAPGDVRIDKHRISGFWDTPLDAILRNLGVTTLIFAGVNADHCVLGTLMDGNFKGYDTIMLEDGVATTSPDFCLQAAVHNVRFCFGFTATSADLADALALETAA